MEIEIKTHYAKTQIVTSRRRWLFRPLRHDLICPDAPANPSITTRRRHSLGGSSSSGDRTAHLLLARQEIQEPYDLAGSRIGSRVGTVHSSANKPGKGGRNCAQGAGQASER